jgi:hypothetical protein
VIHEALGFQEETEGDPCPVHSSSVLPSTVALISFTFRVERLENKALLKKETFLMVYDRLRDFHYSQILL